MGNSKIEITENIFEIVVVDDSVQLNIEENPFEITLGTSGPQGPAGQVSPGDLGYVHIESIPNASWTIIHGLSFIPSITIVDSAGTAVEGDYNYPNENTVIATFVGAFSGKAYLS